MKKICVGCKKTSSHLYRSYCPNCTLYLKAKGYLWSEYYQDYVRPDKQHPGITDVLEMEEKIKKQKQLTFDSLKQRRLF